MKKIVWARGGFGSGLYTPWPLAKVHFNMAKLDRLSMEICTKGLTWLMWFAWKSFSIYAFDARVLNFLKLLCVFDDIGSLEALASNTARSSFFFDAVHGAVPPFPSRVPMVYHLRPTPLQLEF